MYCTYYNHADLNLQFFNILLTSSVNVNIRDNYGDTALSHLLKAIGRNYIISNKAVSLVKSLLKKLLEAGSHIHIEIDFQTKICDLDLTNLNMLLHYI